MPSLARGGQRSSRGRRRRGASRGMLALLLAFVPNKILTAEVPCFAADSPAVRLSLAQVKARLAAGTEETPPDLSRTDLSRLDLSGVDFRRANLTGSRLVGTKLVGANLFTSDLTDAVLTGSDLRKANLDGTVLRRANLERANLTGASLF